MTKIIDTYGDFVNAVFEHIFECITPQWRAGQTAFNILVQVRPDIAEMLRGSDYDPFHQDYRLPAFYDFVWRHWGDDKVTPE